MFCGGQIPVGRRLWLSLEAVGVYKQRKIIKVAHYYMMRKRLGLYMPCRFDVIAIEKDQITLLRNAFGES